VRCKEAASQFLQNNSYDIKNKEPNLNTQPQTAEERKHAYWQQQANEQNKSLYVYELENGNRFETFDLRLKSEKIGGAKVSKLIEIIKPEKVEKKNGQA